MREIKERTNQMLHEFFKIHRIYRDLFKDGPGQLFTSGIITPYTLIRNPEHITLLNYFECLGFLWNGKYIDRNIVQQHMYGCAVISFNLFRKYIEAYRSEFGNPYYCYYWEKMVDELNMRALMKRIETLAISNRYAP